MTDLKESIEGYYKDLGNGDPLTGARKAKQILAVKFFDTVANDMALPSDLREKAFFAKVSFEFADKYERLAKGTQ